MHSILYNYISERTGMSLQEFEAEIQPYFIPTEFKKKEFFLSKGEICRQIAFITKGLMITCSHGDNDVKHVLAFGFENYWVAERESFFLQQPSNSSIQAFEPTSALILQGEDYKNLIENNVLFRNLTARLKEKHAVFTERKVACMRDYTAEKKYQSFLEIFPTLPQRVPQHMIASYLGIKPETLSRLRKKPNKV